jgi:hypothetical protein
MSDGHHAFVPTEHSNAILRLLWKGMDFVLKILLSNY